MERNAFRCRCDFLENYKRGEMWEISYLKHNLYSLFQFDLAAKNPYTGKSIFLKTACEM